MENIGDLTPVPNSPVKCVCKKHPEKHFHEKEKVPQGTTLIFWYYYTVFNQSIYVESFMLSLLSTSFQNVVFNVNPIYANVLFLHS